MQESILHFLRQLEQRIRIRTTHIGRLATRLNRMAFFGFDQVFWSRLFRSRRGPVPIELPLFLLERKGVAIEAPVLYVSGLHREVAHWDDGFAGVYAVLFENLQMPDVLSEVRYAHPAPAFRGVYLWDSAFIAQIWKHWDHSVAHDVADAVIRLRDGDRFQHVVSDLISSKFTQPPLIAWSLVSIWEGRPIDEIRRRLSPLFDPLVAYNRWLYENRCLENGLFAWAHPYESGVENAPRFSSRDESVLLDTTSIGAPDLSAYVVLQNESLATLARWLDRDPEPFEDQANSLRKKMREELWHEEDGLFYDRNVETGEWVRSSTIASLLPLWAGAPDQEKAERLLENILRPGGFNSPLPFPTVALDDPNFDNDMWRGPVWINTAFAAVQGLERYGFDREASELAFRLCDGVYGIFDRERRFYEFYDPTHPDVDRLHRKKGNRWKAITLGSGPQSGFVGWTGLVNTLVIEQLFGFHRREGRRFLRPRFPKNAIGRGYALRLPGEGLAIDVNVLDEDHVRIFVRSEKTGLTESRCRFGEVVSVDSSRSVEPVSTSHPA